MARKRYPMKMETTRKKIYMRQNRLYIKTYTRNKKFIIMIKESNEQKDITFFWIFTYVTQEHLIKQINIKKT